MKAFKENIGMASNSLSSSHENDPFNIPKDPLKEAIDEFVTRKKETTEQHNENFTEKDAMELVRNEVNDIEVDLGNPVAAVEEIIQCLSGGESVEISEDIKKYIEFAVSEKTNFLRDLKRLGINRDNPSREEKKLLREMALEDAEWIGDVVEYIRENRDNPKEIENFWEEYDKTFLSFKEHKNNKNFTQKYSIEQGLEVIKRGILTEIAAMDLLEELANDFEGCKKVKIEYPTPEQDVYDKIDFFLVVAIRTKKINTTKRIPVQVKSCDISGFTNRGSNRKELKRKVQFVLDNVVNTNKTKEGVFVDKNYRYQARAKKRMDEFFSVSKNINGKGLFVILPYGNLNPEFLNPQDKSGKATENCINNKGVPSEALRNHFSFESKMKNSEEVLKM